MTAAVVSRRPVQRQLVQRQLVICGISVRSGLTLAP